MGRTRAVVRDAAAAAQQVATGTVRASGVAQVAVAALAQQLRVRIPAIVNTEIAPS